MRHCLLTLITLLCLATVFNDTAYAGKLCNSRKDHSFRPSANTDSVTAGSLLLFAQSLIGTRYRAATSDPSRGFDCSGFVSYVFKRFNFAVPRSSCEFINIGEKVRLEDARPGDIILFTGTRTHHYHSIGHVGIVMYNGADEFRFIHSTSGKEHGVTITAMDDLYRHRFVQVIRLLKQNNAGQVI